MRGGAAFDYEAQEWVPPGPRADALLVEQARSILGVIDDPAYQRMMGHTPADAARVKAAALHVLAVRS